ncbi:hypothetical protein L1987_84981 [Smallanthus sonchifolius]|uniref:Uncharacterized protein n=1 Tax=Smallanthus sonchifolius TaxID=185202 RepID=A0ACB8XVF1_9ASTR|nr:hypothetical protein L1987_84981 [Smallanthus sonchifolius]
MLFRECILELSVEDANQVIAEHALVAVGMSRVWDRPSKIPLYVKGERLVSVLPRVVPKGVHGDEGENDCVKEDFRGISPITESENKADSN